VNFRSGKTLACAAVIALATLQPAPLFACAACYGASDSPMAQGMNWGILTLLGVILSVLTMVIAFFVHLGRTSAKLRAGERAPTQTDKLP
jgi:hypothetical protein